MGQAEQDPDLPCSQGLSQQGVVFGTLVHEKYLFWSEFFENINYQ